MDLGMFVGLCLGLLVVTWWVLKNVNGWYYEKKLDAKVVHNLPPGNYGWPFVGNMWPFLKAFKSNNPESFISAFVDRYGNSGIYKAAMYGNPSIIVTTPEASRKVLTDDDSFIPGWPSSTKELIGRKSFLGFTGEEHRWLRKLTAAPVNGHEALSMYLRYIEDNVVTTLEKWTTMGQIEFLTELRKLTFTIIMHIFLGAESENVREALEREYTTLNYGVRAMKINLPGFVYHSALKARKRLVETLQTVVTKRRQERSLMTGLNVQRDMMDALMEAKDEKGRRLDDEVIIDILIMYLNAGHESSGHTTMWAALLLQKHPQIFRKAKAEQEEIVKNRPPEQKSLTLKEIRKMDYLSKVVDETLRYVTFSLTVFREATKNVNIGGYTIPKGWKVLVWFRSIHYDHKIYPEPMKFDPSRWDDFIPKAGQFLPFGAGGRLCPGNDLAKLEISIFLHHFLLNYKLEQMNPDSPVMYLPHTRPMDNCVARIKRVT